MTRFAHPQFERSRSVLRPLRWASTLFAVSAFVLLSAPAASAAIKPAVALGELHSCALTSAGGVKCWGAGTSGQLGDGLLAVRPTAADVRGLMTGVVAIAAGRYHSCALTSAGGVKCWGAGTYGQLGDGYLVNRKLPVDVRGLTSGVIAITAGSFHTCALTRAGGVKCWGVGNAGQIGDGGAFVSGRVQRVPVDVIGLTGGVVAITADGGHTCALTSAGGVKCWGANSSGQVGDGTGSFGRTAPVDVIGLATGVAAIAAGGGHTCALMRTGGVKCWGEGTSGQLGDGSLIVRVTPVDVRGLSSGVAALAAGAWHTCALMRTGGVKCWGANMNGQLGDATLIQRPTAVDVRGLQSGVVAIDAYTRHTCAVMSTGGVKCWGFNVSGQLGDGTASQRPTPVDVRGLIAAPDFGLAVTPTSFAVPRGTPAQFRVSITAVNGFAGSVSLAVAGVPAGVQALFNPSSTIRPGAAGLTVVVRLTTPPGTYRLTVTGTSGPPFVPARITRTFTVTLTVK